MTPDTFRTHAHELVDWMADYLESVRDYPVRSQSAPGDLLNVLPTSAPELAEPFETVFADFQNEILPGITHWQHPRFHAYFPANSSPPSVLAEMLTATLGAQCMLWETSPAAAELEQRCLEWLRDLLGLPAHFEGVIQDTASSATLCALLSAREQATGWTSNHTGLAEGPRFTVYASSETHSSLDKAVRIAGIGSDNLRKVAVDSALAMDPVALARAIEADRESGFTPLCVVATLGTTGSTAIDPLAPVGTVCRDQGVWLHVDAAYAGAAFLLPELRSHLDGIENVDSFVFNPHKWMGVNFDCSAYYVRDRGTLVQTFEINPEYLKTGRDAVVHNYRDWGIALGRRFRALKLWFVLRCYGADGLRTLLRNHIAWAQELAAWVDNHPDFERVAPVPFGLVCFRYCPGAGTVPPAEALATVGNGAHSAVDEHAPSQDPATIDHLNEILAQRINDDGRCYVTKTRLHDQVVLRFSIGQTSTTRDDVLVSWNTIQEIAAELPGS
jgi:aromatic-L-amino-acid decarboxylase